MTPKPTLLPFDLAKALAGARVVTRDGEMRGALEPYNGTGEYVGKATMDDGGLIFVLKDGRLYRGRETDSDLFLLADSAQEAGAKPVVVCLCGSSKHPELHMRVMMDETLAGRIVIPMGLYGHADFPSGAKAATNDGDESTAVKQMLDTLHHRKIDVADEVLVVRVAGYIGNSTRREIEYAESKGKHVRYFDWGQPTPATSGDSMDVHYKQLEAERDAWRDSFRAINVKLINLLHAHGTGETEFKDGEKIDEMVERIVAQRDALQKRCDSLVGGLTELKRCVSEIIMPCARTITLDSEQKTIWEACTSKVDALLRRDEGRGVIYESPVL